MNQVRVGTGLIVVKDKKVLVGRRKGSHASELYSFPGGHLDCVLRELKEECGKIKVEIRGFNPTRPEWFVTNDIMPQYEKHYKCEGWEWLTYDHLVNLSQHGECANWIPMQYISEFRNKLGI